MIIIFKVLPYLIVTVAIVQGIILLLRGKFRRKFAKGYDISYEGLWVRVLGTFSILMGIFFALVIFEIISGLIVFVMFLLMVLPGGFVGIIVQQNGIVIKR